MKRILISIIILAVLGGGYYAYSKGYLNQWLPKSYPTDEDGNRIFSEEETRQYDQYMKEAHEFMVQADAGKPELYKNAVEAYKKASAIGEDKFWNPLLGLADAYRKLHEFEKAEEAYNKALQASFYGVDKIYLDKINMYRYDLKKSDSDIKKLYEEAISKVTDNINLVLNYGSYLKAIGDYSGALKAYELILERFPDNPLYKKEVENLKAKIKN